MLMMRKVQKIAPAHKKQWTSYSVLFSGDFVKLGPNFFFLFWSQFLFLFFCLNFLSKLVPISCSEFFSTRAAEKGITSYSSLLGRRTLLQIQQTRKTVKQFDHIINCWYSWQAFWCQGPLRQSRPPCKYCWNFFLDTSCLFLHLQIEVLPLFCIST